MTLNEITGIIVDTAMHIQMKLGPGLLESVYKTILAHELRKRGLQVATEVPIPLVWDDLRFDIGFRADLIVENAVIVELKSVETLGPTHHKQLRTHLCVADKRVGLLINFGVALLKDGIKRIVNGLDE